jgi:hypothetical protein
MATLAEYYDVIKAKKLSSFIASRAYSNFPHRLGIIGLSGSVSYTVDQRDFSIYSSPANGSVAFKFVASLNMALVSPWNRVFLTKVPSLIPIYSSTSPDSILDVREFGFLHSPQYMWEALFSVNYDADYKNVGSVVVTEYTYSTSSNSWGVTNTFSSSVECDLSVFIADGGHPISGGNDGTSACIVSSICNFIGDYSGYLNGIGTADFERLPWDGTWASESTAFSDGFSQILSDGNAADGGGHSGTCGMSMVFTNV